MLMICMNNLYLEFVNKMNWFIRKIDMLLR